MKSDDPTPAQIKAECEKIRAGWSEAQRRRAEAKRPLMVSIPVVQLPREFRDRYR